MFHVLKFFQPLCLCIGAQCVTCNGRIACCQIGSRIMIDSLVAYAHFDVNISSGIVSLSGRAVASNNEIIPKVVAH